MGESQLIHPRAPAPSPPRPAFDPRLHAIQGPRGPLVNQYILDDKSNGPDNPFAVMRAAWGEPFLAKLWAHAYTTAYKEGDPAFVGILNGGLCSGFAGTVGESWDEARFHGQPPLARRDLRRVFERLLVAHCHVLTNELLLHYKYFLTRGPEVALATLKEWVKPTASSTVVTFSPKLDLAFAGRLSMSHAVVVVEAQPRSDGGLTLSVWDPNMPGKVSGPLQIDGAGSFHYTSDFGAPGGCLISNEPGRSEVDIVQGHARGRVLREMAIVPVPSHAFFAAPAPYFDGWTVLFG